jgi:hypothetical protein
MNSIERCGSTVLKGEIFAWVWVLLTALHCGSIYSRTTVEQLNKGMWAMHNDWSLSSVCTLETSPLAVISHENYVCKIGSATTSSLIDLTQTLGSIITESPYWLD